MKREGIEGVDLVVEIDQKVKEEVTKVKKEVEDKEAEEEKKVIQEARKLEEEEEEDLPALTVVCQNV